MDAANNYGGNILNNCLLVALNRNRKKFNIDEVYQANFLNPHLLLNKDYELNFISQASRIFTVKGNDVQIIIKVRNLSFYSTILTF